MSKKEERIPLTEKLRLLLRGCRLIESTKRFFWLSKLSYTFFSTLYPFINIYLSAMILNELTGQRRLSTLIMLVCVTVGANFVCLLCKNALLRWSEKTTSLGYFDCHDTLYKKQRTLDYIDTEDANLRKKIEEIEQHMRGMGLGLTDLTWRIDELFGSFLQVAVSVSLAFTMFVLPVTRQAFAFLDSPWMLILTVLVIAAEIVISVWMRVKVIKVYTDLSSVNNASNRIFWFFSREFSANSSLVRDVHIFRQQELIEKCVDFSDSMSCFYKAAKIAARCIGVSNFANYFSIAYIYLYAGAKALGGAFGVGSIVQYVGALTQFAAGVSNFAAVLSGLFVDAKYLKKLFEFLDMPNQKYLGSLSVEQRDDNEYEIEFHDVSFRYPGSKDYALKHVNMKFKIGKRMAVVGQNGSGKTTMIKLLCRLYDPTEGKITLNGIDIKKYNYDQYMGIFSVVFQDFSLLPFSLGENVAASVRYDRERAAACLREAGFGDRLSRMEKGLDTMLYKNFDEDGVDISGGEAQKIALARAIYKNAPFIVLDEPTAALDPIAEAEVYRNFNKIVENRTTVYISHRLSSCRFCEDIAVFDKGELVQRGSHDTLLADEDGMYYQLWHAQAQYYVNEEKGV